MATQAPPGLDVKHLNDEISTTYGKVATDPTQDFHFHRGAEYAVSFLGYDRDELERVPLEATESFAGVANPLGIDDLAAGQVVLDVGSGAGMDLLIAAARVGEHGRAIGVDMTTEMIEKATTAAANAGLGNVDIRRGDAMNLPVADAEVDVVISNGVVNLTPDKMRVFSEIFRVIKPGGRLLLGDIVVGEELDEDTRSDVDLWTGWIAGALRSAELVTLLGRVGFQDARVVEEFDPFLGTSKEPIARQFKVIGVNVFARKPRRAQCDDPVAELEAENLRLREENRRLSGDIDARSRECEVKNVRLEAMIKKLSEVQTQLVMQEKMASLGNLVAGVAHEINSPIGAVASAADSNLRCMDKFRSFVASMDSPPFPLDCDKLFNILDGNNAVIAEASDRITNIVRSLKMFARLDEAEYQEADIHQGIDSTLTLLEHETKDRVTITRDFAALPAVTCYPSQLNQVFMNLLANASQAIQNGNGNIHISTRQDGGDVVVTIRDDGVGIAAEDIEKIFDPGFTTKGVGVGTGLGLSITHNIIKKHGGDITVTSREGEGTTFTITLPIAGTPAPDG